jgi:hypothetical protein
MAVGGYFATNALTAAGTTTSVTYYGCVIASSGTLSDVTTNGTPPTCPPNSRLISFNSGGSSGTNGTNGSSVVTSSGVPSGTCTTGNTDIDLANGEVYTCTSSAWMDTGSTVKGTNGTNGANGASLLTSSGVPSGTCTTGNTDIDLANGEVYTCTSSAWMDTGSTVKGANGSNGFSFTTDPGTSLTFSCEVEDDLFVPDETATAFVTEPDGSVLAAAPIGLLLGVTSLLPLTVVNPEVGAYQVGVELTSPLISNSITDDCAVTWSGSGQTTALSPMSVSTNDVSSTQESTAFTFVPYGP